MKRNINIMKTRPHVSDSEINKFMDFDALLAKQKQLDVQNTNARTYRVIGLAAGALIILSVVWFLSSLSEERKPRPKSEAQQTDRQLPRKDENKSTEPIQSNSASTNENSNKHLPQHKSMKSTTRENIEKSEPLKRDETHAEEAPAVDDAVYIQAEPLDGFPALYQYFSRELKYPQEALKDSVQGVVSVVFTINVQGKPEHISVDQSLGIPFDKECIRLVTNMPAWKPASYKGKSVASKISLPLTFRIQKIKTK